MVASNRFGEPRGPRCSRSGCDKLRSAAFTLMELLVVVGIITLFVGVIGFGFLRGSGNATAGLQASQSIVVGLLTQARSQAILTGRDAALLVNDNPNNLTRYRRFLCVVVRDAANNWQAVDAGVYLPPGVYVVPAAALTSGDVDQGNWSALQSGALEVETSNPAIESTSSESWLRVGFNSRGVLLGGVGSAGNIVLATGRSQAPGASPPFLYTNPNGVRGVAITVYGLTRMLNDARDFGS